MRDLSSQVTAFVVSVDDDTENLRHCCAALGRQDVLFRHESIHNVAPMDRGFQQMVDRCETPYFVQVDHDMILNPDGIRKLYDNMVRCDDMTAIYCLPLWDEHLQRTILGCKIYKTDIMRRYPYQESFSCEMDQFGRMKKDGYKLKAVWSHFEPDDRNVGRHGVYYTPRTIFIRYKRLMEKSRLFPWIGWVGVLPQDFKQRFQLDPSDLNFWAMAGSIAGMTSNIDDCKGELDFRKAASLPEYDRLKFNMNPKGPTEAILYMTDKCNMECRWCRRNLVDMEKTGDVGLHQVETLLKKFPTIKTACLAGFGEPLMANDLWEIVNCLKKNNVTAGLITNGSLVTKNIAALGASGFLYVSVSLNGVDAKSHEAVTGGKTWPAVVDGIKALVEGGFCDVFVSYVVHRDNLDEISRLLDLVREWGVKKVDLHNLLPHADGAYDDEGFWSKVLCYDDDEVASKLETLAHHPEAYRIRTWPVLIAKDAPPKLCRSPFFSIGLNGLGFAGGCQRVTPPARSHSHITGENVWHNNYLLNLRAQLLGDRPLDDVCRMCFGNWKW